MINGLLPSFDRRWLFLHSFVLAQYVLLIGEVHSNCHLPVRVHVACISDSHIVVEQTLN